MAQYDGGGGRSGGSSRKSPAESELSKLPDPPKPSDAEFAEIRKEFEGMDLNPADLPQPASASVGLAAPGMAGVDGLAAADPYGLLGMLDGPPQGPGQAGDDPRGQAAGEAGTAGPAPEAPGGTDLATIASALDDIRNLLLNLPEAIASALGVNE